MKRTLTIASAVALMAVPAIAQETTMPKTTAMPSEQQEMAPEKTAAHAGKLSAADLLNHNVKTATGEAVGDINDIRIGNDGNIAAVIVGVGGFLGMGEKNVALEFDKLAFARDADGALIVTTTASKDELQAAPEWKNPEDRS